jgi:hypothetical protein|uniref:Uncharacterized protein n=1 Tax=viral metagenome TaxID=1070528 RepID=A0A6C0JK51_9ZZZZ
MFNLCKYKDIFGKPNTGVHKYRIFKIAVVDVLVVIIFSYIIFLIFKFPFLYTLGFMFLLGIFTHRIFCVRTTVDKLLFPNST